MNPEELLNKYLDRALNPSEKDEFEALYRQSGEFRNQVDLYRDLLKGIEWSEIQKIRSEVNQVHSQALDGMNKAFEFQDEVAKSLRLKNRQGIKEEIQNAMKDNTKKSGTVIPLAPRKWLAIAASLIVLISVSILVLFRKNTISVDGKDSIGKAFSIIKEEAQQSGMADPTRENHIHETRIFELLAQNEIKQASDLNALFYSDHPKDYRYFQLLGWIYYHSGQWTQARESFQTASKMGDPCMSKLLYAFLIPYEKQSKEIISEVRADVACRNSESVVQLLSRINK